MSRVLGISAGIAAVFVLLAWGISRGAEVRVAPPLHHAAQVVEGDAGDKMIMPQDPSAPSSADGIKPRLLEGESKTDLEGDEVSPALATYGIDREGNLYEVHSPHTELPRLPGPTT